MIWLYSGTPGSGKSLHAVSDMLRHNDRGWPVLANFQLNAVVPTVAALSPPASFLSALQTTMTTKFPFCLPFDLFKILQAFYVAPEAPVFSLSFHDPFSNSDFSIRVDLSPWDEVAAVVRNFEAMILLAGFCLNFDKFNVIHLILGGLG